MLALLPVLLGLASAPAASATCGAINAYVPDGKAWYGASDAPPQLLFNLVDDERTARDFANETTGTYFTTTGSGPFGWVATPPWSTYARGVNSVRAAIFCGAGTQTARLSVGYDPDRPTVAWTAPAANQWISGTVALQLAGDDGISGVDHFLYALPNRTVSSASGAATLDTTGLPDGPRALVASDVDAAGNVSDVVTRTVRIDNTPPVATLDAPAEATVVSAALTLSARASDNLGSGVAQVRFDARPASGGSWQALGSAGEAPYRIVSAGLADGAYDVRAVATDALGNESSTPATSITIARAVPAGAPAAVAATVSSPALAATPRKARVSLTAIALPRRVESGRAVVVHGRLGGVAHRVVLVTLRHSSALVQRVRAITTRTGTFRVSLHPRFSGTVSVRFAGDRTHRAAAANAGTVRVHPRLVATVSATRELDGSFANPHVHGRMAPGGAPAQLVWQARPAHGGSWLLFCRAGDQIVVGRNGVIDGVCHVSGLHADNRYRLVLVGGSAASYLPAVTAPLVARPTR